MNSDYEVQASQDGGESGDEDGQASFNHLGVAESGTEGGVESPAGIHSTGQNAVQVHDAGDDVEIPAQQIDARKGQVFGSDHQRHEKIPKHRRNGRNKKEKDHHLAVHGEELVVGVGLNQVTGRSEQFQANQQREEAANEKEECDGNEIEQRNALVVRGQQP